jgi:hypothetical protein
MGGYGIFAPRERTSHRLQVAAAILPRAMGILTRKRIWKLSPTTRRVGSSQSLPSRVYGFAATQQRADKRWLPPGPFSGTGGPLLQIKAGLRERNVSSYVALHHEEPKMADTEKADAPNVKKQTPPPMPPNSGPLHSGVGLESPRSTHC